MMVLLAVVVVVLAAGGAFAAALARSSKRRYDRQGRIVAGVESKAPASWSGAHTPEAKLHRRLVAAVAAVRANAAAEFTSARTTFESEALALDDRLIAAAALPEAVRAEPMAKVEAAVVALEAAAGALASQQVHGDPAALAGAVADVDDRMRALAEARAELDRTDPPATGS